MSRQGWQICRPGRLIRTYRRGEGAWCHRLGYCAGAPGSAEDITFLAAQRRGGWEPAFRRKGWILFRKRAEDAAAGEALPDNRDSVRKLFSGRIARQETLRRWMLVLAAILLILGYLSMLRPVLYATVLPLLVALLATYRIKFMEEGAQP